MAYFALSAAPKKASAANDCWYSSPTEVTCAKPAFTLLKDGLVTAREELRVCQLHGESLVADLKLCDAKVAELTARVQACEAPKEKPSAIRPVSGYVMGLLGVASVAASLAIPMPDAAKWSVGLGGVALTGAGVVFVLP